MTRLFEPQNKPALSLQSFILIGFTSMLFSVAMVGAWLSPHLNMALFQKTILVECVLLGFFTAWSVHLCLKPGSFEWLAAPINKPLLAILLWGVASLGWSVFADYTLVRLLLWLAAGAGFVLLVTNLRGLAAWKQLFLWFFISGVLIALTGIAQHLFGFQGLPQTAPPAATFINKNIAVHVIVFVLPISIYLFFNEQAKQNTPFFVSAATAVVAAYLVYTQTRSGWLAVSIEAIFVLIALYCCRQKARQSAENQSKTRLMASHHKRALLLGGILFLALVNASETGFFTKGALWSTLDSISTDARNYGGQQVYSRYQIWSETFQAIKQAPLLGHGLGTFEYAFSEQGGPELQNLRRVHNDFLEFVYELGLVGLALALWLFISLVRVISQLWRGLSGDHYLLFVSVTAAIIGSAVNAFFSFPYTQALPPVLLMVCCAALVYLYSCLHTASESRVLWSNGARTVFASLASALLLIVLMLAWQWTSYFNVIESGIHQQVRDWSMPEAEQQKIVIVHPEMAHTLSRLSDYSASADPTGFMYSWNAGLAEAYLKIKPNDYQANLRLIGYYLNQEEFQQAVLIAKQALELPVKDARQALLPPLISGLEQLQQQDEADAYYRQLIDLLITPGNRYSALIINQFVMLNLTRKDDENFYRVLRRCVEEYPEDWQYQALLGVRLYKSGRRQEAQPFLARAMTLNPSNPYQETLNQWLGTYP